MDQLVDLGDSLRGPGDHQGGRQGGSAGQQGGVQGGSEQLAVVKLHCYIAKR